MTDHAEVWLWCAHLMQVESSAVAYAEPPSHTPEDQAARWAEVDRLDAAGDAFYAKAVHVAGAPIASEDWERALERFHGPDRW